MNLFTKDTPVGKIPDISITNTNIRYDFSDTTKNEVTVYIEQTLVDGTTRTSMYTFKKVDEQWKILDVD